MSRHEDTISPRGIAAPAFSLGLVFGGASEGGQTLGVLEAMKMKSSRVASAYGTVVEILAKAGDQLDAKDLTMAIGEKGQEAEAAEAT